MKIWDFRRSDSDFKFCQSGQINQRFLFCKLAGMILYVLNAGIITTLMTRIGIFNAKQCYNNPRICDKLLGGSTIRSTQPNGACLASRKLLYRLSLAPQDNLGKVSWHRWGGVDGTRVFKGVFLEFHHQQVYDCLFFAAWRTRQVEWFFLLCNGGPTWCVSP